jgi:hypothetical protein
LLRSAACEPMVDKRRNSKKFVSLMKELRSMLRG